MPLHQWFADRIDPFVPAEGPPPQTLKAFFGWALAGSGLYIKLAIFASVSVGIATVAGFWMIGWTIDAAQAAGPGFLADRWGTLLAIALFYLVVWPGAMVANAAFNSLMLGPNLYAMTLARINHHLIGQSLSYFDDDFAGRLAQKAQQTARAVTEVVNEGTNIFGNAMAAALGAAALLTFVDLRLGVIILAWCAGYVVLLRYFIPKIRVKSKDRAAKRAVVTGQIVDTVTNIVTVKLFANSRFEDGETTKALSRYRASAVDWAGTVVWFRLAIFILAGLLPVTLIGVSLWLWSLGVASAGDIAAAGLISTRLATMTGWVSFAALGIFANIGEIEDGVRTLTPPHTITDRPDLAVLSAPRGEIAFDNVSFGYGKPEAALKNFTLRVAPGEKVALVGQSGAGKSTVLSLLLRLYEVEAGRVLFDGTDIRDLSQEGLRAAISTVRQETAMFNRSARDNILYGRPQSTEAEVIAAAQRAEAHAFIQDLRDFKGRAGYDAHLGERGVKLSGGQRQRIALARAILKDAPVLLLDEATSALDSEVEAEIQAALAEVMENKTVIAIAHRLSTVARMDRILVMEAGQIVEEGTHSDLLRKGERYARYWSRQSGGFLNLEAAE